MRTIISLLLMLGISVCSHAQNQILSRFEKKHLYDNLQKDTCEHFAISPHFKSKTLPCNFKYSHQFKGDSLKLNYQDSLFSDYPVPEFRMPVAKNSYYFKMPVVVPDSSVHYYLRVKRIPIVNPLEGK